MSPDCKNKDEVIMCRICKEWTCPCDPCCPGSEQLCEFCEEYHENHVD